MASKTDQEIRDLVRESYGSRVRGVLSDDELIPLTVVATGDACDASDACCGSDPGSEGEITRIAELYRQEDIGDLPSTVTDVAFGCGNPTAIAALRTGETVLDLGSGGGIDCFLAAKMVGPSGRVIGVDMTPEMIELAQRNREKVGAGNVDFRLGTIESLPVEDGCVDVVISNCVINLSPDKDEVFREAFRVLRPGGRLQVSDIVWTKPVPDDVRGDMEKWAGCIAGALLEADYLASIARAGFADITSVANEYEQGRGLASASVVAFRPADQASADGGC